MKLSTIAAVTFSLGFMPLMAPAQDIRQSRELGGKLVQQIDSDMAQRKARIKRVRGLKGTQGELYSIWTDGKDLYALVSPDDNTRYELRNTATDSLLGHFTYRTADGRITTRDMKGVTQACICTFGNARLLLLQDSKGQTKHLFTESQLPEISIEQQTFDAHFLYDGLYMTDDSLHALFGPNRDYPIDRFEGDPGPFFVSYEAKPSEGYAHCIAYGGGRISHGDPSSPNFGKMPGGGGAAALMGPMLWDVRPTLEGLAVKVVRDEPFVDHNPRFHGEEFQLRHVASPYAEVPGHWAFASVRPVTRAMLQMFPREALPLIRAEIYARHGHRFTNAERRAYFNQQPWYKAVNTPTPLTDVEKLNVQLIEAEMQMKE